tara:strand:- start:1 stop:177 length:177 start_codon:yes stop_codon:yes gene_type:complete
MYPVEFHFGFYAKAFLLEKMSHSLSKALIRNPMRAVGWRGQVTALDLMWTLRTCFNPL